MREKKEEPVEVVPPADLDMRKVPPRRRNQIAYIIGNEFVMVPRVRTTRGSGPGTTNRQEMMNHCTRPANCREEAASTAPHKLDIIVDRYLATSSAPTSFQRLEAVGPTRVDEYGRQVMTLEEFMACQLGAPAMEQGSRERDFEAEQRLVRERLEREEREAREREREIMERRELERRQEMDRREMERREMETLREMMLHVQSLPSRVAPVPPLSGNTRCAVRRGRSWSNSNIPRVPCKRVVYMGRRHDGFMVERHGLAEYIRRRDAESDATRLIRNQGSALQQRDQQMESANEESRRGREDEKMRKTAEISGRLRTQTKSFEAQLVSSLDNLGILDTDC
jgi:hypothetical protein